MFYTSFIIVKKNTLKLFKINGYIIYTNIKFKEFICKNFVHFFYCAFR